MVKKNGQINNNRAVIKKLSEWAKALNRNISIRVGIIGEQAHEKHEDSDLTNAELGAVQEFGAEIKVTDKMRGWFYGVHDIYKTNEPVKIPSRSFLREPLLSKEGKKELTKAVEAKLGKDFEASELSENTANKLLDDAAHLMAETAYLNVLKAFDEGGKPTAWKPITDFTKENRKYNSDAPPLTDSGQLRKSISYDIKEKS